MPYLLDIKYVRLRLSFEILPLLILDIAKYTPNHLLILDI